MKKYALLLLLLVGYLNTNAQINCSVDGVVTDRPYSKVLYLIEYGLDFRVNEYKTIPITNGKFHFKISDTEPTAYQLIFEDELRKGSWRPIFFTSYNGVISMQLYPKELFTKTQIKGGTDNHNYSLFEKEITNLIHQYLSEISAKINSFPRENSRTKIGKALDDKINQSSYEEIQKLMIERDSLIKKGLYHSKEYQLLVEEGDRQNELVSKKLDSIKLKLPSLIHFAQNVSALKRYDSIEHILKQNSNEDSKFNTLKEHFEFYTKVFPKSKYTYEGEQVIDNHKKIIAKKRYLDFIAPDLSGNPIKLSKEIKGKIAIIDFWASWCGPCRRKSSSYIPLYNKYKSKGFTIVGIAREKNNTTAMKQAINKDGYPWLNLVELNDQNKLWEKYNLGNGGGGTFLVDEKGTILIKNPTAQQVEEILQAKLSL